MGHEKGTFNFQFREDQITMKDGKAMVQLPNSKEFNDLKFRRCLYHIGFNYACWKFWQKVLLEKRFDNVRRYVRKGKPKGSWMYAQVSYADDLIRKRCEIAWIKDAPGLVIKLESFVDDFYMDLEQDSKFEVWVREHLGNNALLHYCPVKLSNKFNWFGMSPSPVMLLCLAST